MNDQIVLLALVMFVVGAILLVVVNVTRAANTNNGVKATSLLDARIDGNTV